MAQPIARRGYTVGRRRSGGNSLLSSLIGSGGIGLEGNNTIGQHIDENGITVDQPPAGSTPPRFKATGSWWQRNLGGGNSIANQMNQQMMLNQRLGQQQLGFLPQQLGIQNRASLGYQEKLLPLQAASEVQRQKEIEANQLANLPQKLNIQNAAQADLLKRQQDLTANQQATAEDELVKRAAAYIGETQPIDNPVTGEPLPVYSRTSSGNLTIDPEYARLARQNLIAPTVTGNAMTADKNRLASTTANATAPGLASLIPALQSHEQNMAGLQEQQAREGVLTSQFNRTKPFPLSEGIIAQPPGSENIPISAATPPTRPELVPDMAKIMSGGDIGAKKTIPGQPATLTPLVPSGNTPSTHKQSLNLSSIINDSTVTFNPTNKSVTVKSPIIVGKRTFKPGDVLELNDSQWKQLGK